MQYDTTEQDKKLLEPCTINKEEDVFPAVIRLFPGDVVYMDDECNDLFQHAVYSSSCVEDDGNLGRISLVLKKAMDRNGKKGHGIAGQGRKSRRK